MLTMEIWKLIDDIQALPSETVDEIFRIRPSDTTIYTSLDVLNEIRLSYSTYKIAVPLHDTDTVSTFITMWTHYKSLTLQQLARAYAAITAEYNPINNYDMTEQAADGHKISKETDTTTPQGGTHTSSTLYKYGLNSNSNGAASDRTETDVTPISGAKTETTRQFDHDKSMDVDGETKTGYHETKEHFLQRSGNIGVTTSAQMVTGELALRKYNLLQEYIKGFIDKYAYTTGGDL